MSPKSRNRKRVREDDEILKDDQLNDCNNTNENKSKDTTIDQDEIANEKGAGTGDEAGDSVRSSCSSSGGVADEDAGEQLSVPPPPTTPSVVEFSAPTQLTPPAAGANTPAAAAAASTAATPATNDRKHGYSVMQFLEKPTRHVIVFGVRGISTLPIIRAFEKLLDDGSGKLFIDDTREKDNLLFIDFIDTETTRRLVLDCTKNCQIEVDGRMFQFGAAKAPNAKASGEHDWLCTQCRANNFADRRHCFQCRRPRDGGPAASDTTPPQTQSNNRINSNHHGNVEGGNSTHGFTEKKNDTSQLLILPVPNDIQEVDVADMLKARGVVNFLRINMFQRDGYDTKKVYVHFTSPAAAMVAKDMLGPRLNAFGVSLVVDFTTNSKVGHLNNHHGNSSKNNNNNNTNNNNTSGNPSSTYAGAPLRKASLAAGVVGPLPAGAPTTLDGLKGYLTQLYKSWDSIPDEQRKFYLDNHETVFADERGGGKKQQQQQQQKQTTDLDSLPPTAASHHNNNNNNNNRNQQHHQDQQQQQQQQEFYQQYYQKFYEGVLEEKLKEIKKVAEAEAAQLRMENQILQQRLTALTAALTIPTALPGAATSLSLGVAPPPPPRF